MATNLTVATRTFYDLTWKSQITYGMPILRRLLERKRMRMGGIWVSNINETADSETLVQEYGPEDGLDAGSKTIMGTSKWNIAFMQCPIEESIDEEIMNRPEGDTQLVKIRDKVTASTQRGMKIRMAKRIWGCASDTEIDDKHTLLQGIPSALYNATYGGVARTTTSNSYWMSADAGASCINIETAVSISKRQIWEWIDSVKYYHEGPESLLIVMGSTLFRSLKAEMEASNSYRPGKGIAKQGFRNMYLDDYEIAEDPFLDTLTEDSCSLKDGADGCLIGEQSAAYTGAGVVALIHLDSWVFRYVKASNSSGKTEDPMFTVTDYFDQSVLPAGKEKQLARVKGKFNLECHQPNANLLRVNVSA